MVCKVTFYKLCVVYLYNCKCFLDSDVQRLKILTRIINKFRDINN